VNALYKAECAKPKRAWQSLQELELETLDWVHWFNTKRLMKKLGWMAPAEYEEQFYARQAAQSCAA
jgi:putative transposase